MKKITSLICAAACAVSVVPFAANAEDNAKVYGTMNIPYADFYAAEIENAYEVDAVSSATKARDRYLAGELTEEEAMAIIYVPKKDELLENISSELTLETAGAKS